MSLLKDKGGESHGYGERFRGIGVKQTRSPLHDDWLNSVSFSIISLLCLSSGETVICSGLILFTFSIGVIGIHIIVLRQRHASCVIFLLKTCKE